ncbi:helix-turn-helix domain-containing protein [Allosphingosinicella sp.]|jgi:AraC-like DNA-binding protein|uniref:helix-turn-helix domain-containing protein n=1 Tax=Allosphingosinicella sp. TaxID=2823234 RepID=UPI002F168062
MIAGCMERMRQDSCGGCDKRDACSRLAEMFGFGAQRGAATAKGPSEKARRSPFSALLGMVATALQEGAKPKPSDFRREVERQIEALLPSGTVAIDRVARALGTSRQTLYRRLKAEGVTFEQLLDGLRRRLALRLIREQGLAVKEAAWRLGFSDPAAFSRAFKRWTGSSPNSVRRPH